MFTYTTQNGVLTVYEAFNGFYITHNPTDETRGMGDTHTYPLCCPESGEPVWDIPTEGYKLPRCWNSDEHESGTPLEFDTMDYDPGKQIEADEWELLAAYFPEHVN